MFAIASVLLCCCLACAVLWRHGRAQRLRLQRALSQSAAERAALQRLAQLAGRDLRDAALRLHVQAGLARPEADRAGAGALAAIAERCRSLATDLGEAGLGATSPGAADLGAGGMGADRMGANGAHPALRDETLDLLACARQSAQAVAAVIAPGLRRFCLPDGVLPVRADRRAIRQVLGRVLTEAAMNTREGDWIALSVAELADAGFALIVADEGLGIAGAEAEAGTAADNGADAARDSRGMAAPLTLARRLMQAHGGTLEVIATPGAGTQVSLLFPRSRRRPSLRDHTAREGVASRTHTIDATLPS